jgi:uncharacterized protein (DUF4415 family)
MSTVRYKQGELPALTEERRAELEALAMLPDATIDYSDTPALSDEFWSRAVRSAFYRPTKTHTTVRIDSDVMVWLKSQGKGYQTRLNSILREAMLESFKKSQR